MKRLEDLKSELQELLCDGGVLVRTKQTLAEEGEKPSKALFQMEKNNQKKKIISEINDGDILHKDTVNIMKTIRKFYKNLYKEKNLNEEKQNKFLENIKKTLSDDENAFLNIPFSSEELYNAAMSLNKGKTPGIDGLPVEFYQECWNI